MVSWEPISILGKDIADTAIGTLEFLHKTSIAYIDQMVF